MKQIFRYIPVLMMLFVSTVASAKSTIKVMPVINGVVEVNRTSASSDKKVTITVTPNEGYYFQKENLEVVKTVNPGVALTRGEVPIANTITVSGSDPSDLTTSRQYTFIVPDDGYEFQVSATFSARTAIKKGLVTLSPTKFAYNGADQKPTVSVNGLTEGTDYTITFAETSWKEVGTYSVSVSGISKYTGTVTKTFTISAVCVGGLYYKPNAETKTAEVTSNPNTYSGSVVIPESFKYKSVSYSVVSIGNSAFNGCSGLTSVTIPYSVTSIGSYSFKNCSRLTDVYSYAEEVPTTNSNAFKNSNIGNATLHVLGVSVGKYKSAKPWKSFKEIVEIESKVKLDKTKVNFEKGKTVTLKATVSPAALPDKSVTWTSSDTKIATVSSKGKVKGVKAGSATITCTSVLTGAKATCKVTVGYVKLDRTEAVVKKGKTVNLTATVYPTTLKDKSVTWESSNTKIATVTSEGKVQGVKVGTATITCTSVATGLSATCEVTVGKVTLNETKIALEKGKTVTLTATVKPTTLADQSVTWVSSNTKVAKVTAAGKVKGINAGTATITCTSVATGLSATCTVTVGYVSLSESEITIMKDKTVKLTAAVYPETLSDKSVTWASSNTKIATVTTAGKVKGVKAGTVTITCTSVATGLSATCTVTVKASASTRSEGDEEDGDEVTTGIDEIEDAVVTEPFDVYNLNGRKVLSRVTSLDGLPDGIYIVNGKKVVKNY